MKLIKCYIENFGKLQKFSYNFQDGLNIIKEENGFGKTTLAVFIKAMFYGLDASKSEKSERKKYKPWQGGIFGGNIEFEVNNKKYKLERFFGSKLADDTFKIYDLSSNLETNDYSENIGEEIFKINKSGYERSTYIPQGEIKMEMEDSISAKLGNVLESENDVNTSDEAIKKISETMKMYVKIGNKGLLNEKKEKLSELQRKLENSKFDIENLETKIRKINEIKESIKICEMDKQKKQQLLSKKIEQDRKNAKIETYSNIVDKLKEDEKKCQEINEFFKNGVPDDEKLNEISDKIIEIEKNQVEIESNDLTQEEIKIYDELKRKYDEKKLTEEMINQQIVNCSKIKEYENEIQIEKNNENNLNKEIASLRNDKERKSKIAIIVLIFSILLIGFGIAAFFISASNIIGIMMIIIGTIGTILSIIISKQKEITKNLNENTNSLEKIQKNISELEKNIGELKKEIDKIAEGLKWDDDTIIVLTNLKAEINLYRTLENKKISKEHRKQGLIIKKQSIENEIKDFFTKYCENSEISFSEQLQQIKIRKSELLFTMQELGKTKKQKEEFEQANDVNELEQEKIEENVDENNLKKDISELDKKIDSLNDEKNQIKNQIEYLENQIDENEYIENDIENLKEEINEFEKRYVMLEKTKELLESAKVLFSSNYLRDMIDGFEQYLKKIDDKKLETNVDINLDVKIDVNGAKKEIKYFSAGYKDLIYICVRFSLIKALFKEELPFVILDDPFVNLDEEKTKKAIELLKEFSKNYQIIYFICNGSRSI